MNNPMIANAFRRNGEIINSVHAIPTVHAIYITSERCYKENVVSSSHGRVNVINAGAMDIVDFLRFPRGASLRGDTQDRIRVGINTSVRTCVQEFNAVSPINFFIFRRDHIIRVISGKMMTRAITSAIRDGVWTVVVKCFIVRFVPPIRIQMFMKVNVIFRYIRFIKLVTYVRPIGYRYHIRTIDMYMNVNGF